jgi:hypothetical protein
LTIIICAREARSNFSTIWASAWPFQGQPLQHVWNKKLQNLPIQQFFDYLDLGLPFVLRVNICNVRNKKLHLWARRDRKRQQLDNNYTRARSAQQFFDYLGLSLAFLGSTFATRSEQKVAIVCAKRQKVTKLANTAIFLLFGPLVAVLRVNICNVRNKKLHLCARSELVNNYNARKARSKFSTICASGRPFEGKYFATFGRKSSIVGPEATKSDKRDNYYNTRKARSDLWTMCVPQIGPAVQDL